MKKKISLVFRATIAIGLFVVVVWQAGGLGAVLAQMGRIDPMYAILILGVFTVDRALMTYKWLRLLWARDQNLPFFRGMKLYAASVLWGMFLPTTLGADAIRAAGAIRVGLDVDQVLASITIERMIGFLSALVLGLLGMIQLSTIAPLGDRYDVLWKAGDVTLLLALLAFMASFSNTVFDFIHNRLFRSWQGNRIMARLRKFHQTYMGYQDVKWTLLVFLGLTLVEQLLPILETAWLAWGMGVEVGMTQIAGAVILTRLLSRVPISIDALGVYEGIFVLLMAAVGVGATEVVAMAVSGRILQVISCLPWWTAHVLESGDMRRPRPLTKGS